MFSGIVRGTGRLERRESRDEGQRLGFRYAGVLSPAESQPGASVAVNGVCITVVARQESCFYADLSAETLARTTLGHLAVGASINLEPALTLGAPVGGHLVTGHVDTVGRLLERRPVAHAVNLRIEAPRSITRFISEKGSIAVDGVSLTVNSTSGFNFEVMLIPATLERTVAGQYVTGVSVNLEADLIARYLDRLHDCSKQTESR